MLHASLVKERIAKTIQDFDINTAMSQYGGGLEGGRRDFNNVVSRWRQLAHSLGHLD